MTQADMLATAQLATDNLLAMMKRGEPLTLQLVQDTRDVIAAAYQNSHVKADVLGKALAELDGIIADRLAEIDAKQQKVA